MENVANKVPEKNNFKVKNSTNIYLVPNKHTEIIFHVKY